MRNQKIFKDIHYINKILKKNFFNIYNSGLYGILQPGILAAIEGDNRYRSIKLLAYTQRDIGQG